MGCYADSIIKRDLNLSNFSSSSQMTINECAKFCNTQFIGLQNGSFCFCGNSFGKPNLTFKLFFSH